MAVEVRDRPLSRFSKGSCSQALEVFVRSLPVGWYKASWGQDYGLSKIIGRQPCCKLLDSVSKCGRWSHINGLRGHILVTALKHLAGPDPAKPGIAVSTQSVMGLLLLDWSGGLSHQFAAKSCKRNLAHVGDCRSRPAKPKVISWMSVFQRPALVTFMISCTQVRPGWKIVHPGYLIDIPCPKHMRLITRWYEVLGLCR